MSPVPMTAARPLKEVEAVASIRIGKEVLVKGIDVLAAIQQTIRNGTRQNCVVGESQALDKQLEVG